MWFYDAYQCNINVVTPCSYNIYCTGSHVLYIATMPTSEFILNTLSNNQGNNPSGFALGIIDYCFAYLFLEAWHNLHKHTLLLTIFYRFFCSTHSWKSLFQQESVPFTWKSTWDTICYIFSSCWRKLHEKCVKNWYEGRCKLYWSRQCLSCWLLWLSKIDTVWCTDGIQWSINSSVQPWFIQCL